MEYIETLYKLDLKSKTIKDILAILNAIFKKAQIKVKIPTPHINKPNTKIINDEDLELLENELIKEINYINFLFIFQYIQE